MDVSLQGADLAAWLANNLTDLEFELLVRERIKNEFHKAHREYPQFAESHNVCRFTFEWNDKCVWNAGLGSTYRDAVSQTGEVLSQTVTNVMHQYEMQTGNKLSKLLPAPPANDDNGFGDCSA